MLYVGLAYLPTEPLRPGGRVRVSATREVGDVGSLVIQQQIALVPEFPIQSRPCSPTLEPRLDSLLNERGVLM